MADISDRGEKTQADRELVVTRVVDAPRRVVFGAWTSPEGMRRWWGPTGYTTTSFEMDLKPGGAWRAHMLAPDGRDLVHFGVYREIVEPERLVFTFAWLEEPEHEMLVTVTFAERDGGTELTVRHAGFRTVEERDSHTEGWTECLGRLADYLAVQRR